MLLSKERTEDLWLEKRDGLPRLCLLEDLGLHLSMLALGRELGVASHQFANQVYRMIAVHSFHDPRSLWFSSCMTAESCVQPHVQYL